MTGEQVVRVVRAIGRCLTALADDLEQITTETSSDEQTAELRRNARRAAIRSGVTP